MSPSKRAQADAAFNAQEDQRALVVVVAAAWSYIEIRDELDGEKFERRTEIEDACARVQRLIKIDTPKPKPEPGLPGQIAIDGTVVGEPGSVGAPMAEVFDVPKQCEECGENMLLVWGGSWTPAAH